MSVVVFKPPGQKLSEQTIRSLYITLIGKGPYQNVTGYCSSEGKMFSRDKFYTDADLCAFLRKTTGDGEDPAVVVFDEKRHTKYILDHGAVCLDTIDGATSYLLESVAKERNVGKEALVETLESITPTTRGVILSTNGDSIIINADEGITFDGLWISKDITTPEKPKEDGCKSCGSDLVFAMEKDYKTCFSCFDDEWIRLTDQYKDPQETIKEVSKNVYTPSSQRPIVNKPEKPPAPPDPYLNAKCVSITFTGN